MTILLGSSISSSFHRGRTHGVPVAPFLGQASPWPPENEIKDHHQWKPEVFYSKNGVKWVVEELEGWKSLGKSRGGERNKTGIVQSKANQSCQVHLSLFPSYPGSEECRGNAFIYFVIPIFRCICPCFLLIQVVKDAKEMHLFLSLSKFLGAFVPISLLPR